MKTPDLDPTTLDRIQLILHMQYWQAHEQNPDTDYDKGYAHGLMVAAAMIDTLRVLDRGEFASPDQVDPGRIWRNAMEGKITRDTVTRDNLPGRIVGHEAKEIV